MHRRTSEAIVEQNTAALPPDTASFAQGDIRPRAALNKWNIEHAKPTRLHWTCQRRIEKPK